MAKSDSGNPHGPDHPARGLYGRSLGRPSSHPPLQASLPGLVRYEGPLRSYAATGSDPRLVLRLYFHATASPLHMTTYIRHLREHTDLCRFAIGSESLYADPAARRVEFTSTDAVPQINQLVEHMVMVSPRLGLMHSRHSAEEWTAALTTMHHANPEVCATLVTWRRPHHRPQLFAAPEMLQTRATATRRTAQTRSRPSRLMRYRRDLLNISIRGPFGLDPDQLLVALMQQVHACLGRPLVQGKGEYELDTHMFWDPRDPKGAWAGTLTLYLPDLAETAAEHALLEGATLQIGTSFATIWVRSQRLDADPSLCLRSPGNGRGGGL